MVGSGSVCTPEVTANWDTHTHITMTTKIDRHAHNMVADAEDSTPGQLHVQTVGGHFLRRRRAIKSAQGLPQHVYYCNRLAGPLLRNRATSAHRHPDMLRCENLLYNLRLGSMAPRPPGVGNTSLQSTATLATGKQYGGWPAFSVFFVKPVRHLPLVHTSAIGTFSVCRQFGAKAGTQQAERSGTGDLPQS